MFNKSTKPNEIKRNWYLVDAKGKVLGRLASRVATILQGKHQAYYSPQWDMGDYVVIINSAEIKVTGGKEEQKKYYRHSGYPGGIKEETLASLRKRKPNDIIYQAVKKMLPKNRLAAEMIKKMKVFPGTEHNHEAQKPVALELS